MVIIDIYRIQGVWLDRDEMQRIIEFIPAGGLMRARTLEKEQLDASRRAAEFLQRTERDPFGVRGGLEELRDDAGSF